MKRDRILYWISTGLLSLMMTGSGIAYMVAHAEVAEVFHTLGYPTYIVYPLAILKLLGVVAILTRKSNLLKNLAYAGFFYDFVLALGAHVHAHDGEFAPSIVALVLLVTFFVYDRKIHRDR